AVVQNGTAHFREVCELLHALEVTGVQQPREIPQQRVAQPMHRQHAPLACLDVLVRSIVREPVEQCGLKAFLRRQLGHVASPCYESLPAASSPSGATSPAAAAPSTTC